MLMSEGRNYGVRFMAITQFFASIDKMSMRYMRQRYFGSTNEPRDVEYVEQFFPKSKRQIVAESLRSLKAGEFIYMNAEGFQKINIEPYESQNTKTEIVIPQSTPAQVEPRAHTENTGILLAKLAIVGLIVLWMLKNL
jgi:L-lactate utilization protein LutC